MEEDDNHWWIKEATHINSYGIMEDDDSHWWVKG